MTGGYKMTDALIKGLIGYALKKKLIDPRDAVYCTNMLLALLRQDSFDDSVQASSLELPQILQGLCDAAVEKGLIEDSVTWRDLFDTALMGALTPMPSAVADRFYQLYARSPAAATDDYYRFSCDTNYIRRDRVAKMLKWQSDSPYGKLDITINLAKPEKDPKAIAAARKAAPAGYPKCHLCKECVGYAGRLDYPARQNHRIIPISICGQSWYLQYSPYTYYNEHCIVFNGEHLPMKIDRSAFDKLLDFVAQFPHYFIGSNADLPIVGGSILSHEHFQGGRYEFPMERAPIARPLVFDGFEDVTAGIVCWPMSTIRLTSLNRTALSALAEKILISWRGYTDADAFIFAETDGEPHNTITAIARRRGDAFELDLVLRNNITTEEHPLGVYHPHAELHHIKKENIGLIEVMGLAVLPARLKPELEAVAKGLLSDADLTADPLTSAHAEWAARVKAAHPELDAGNVEDILRDEGGAVFSEVLEHAGVYKQTPAGESALMRFIDQI